jgi:PncC family amidohydrolase
MEKIITEIIWRAVYNLHNKLIEVDVSHSLEIEIAGILHDRKLKLALAESCTGGLIGDRITDIPGSSEFFWGGVVAYAYEAKVALLGVSWETLNSSGAVSREVVLEMARGTRRALQTDIGVAVSGIAGPGGGTAEKPVGTTWIGLVASDGEWAKLFHFSGERDQNKDAAATAALQFLLDYLEERLEAQAT